MYLHAASIKVILGECKEIHEALKENGSKLTQCPSVTPPCLFELPNVLD